MKQFTRFFAIAAAVLLLSSCGIMNRTGVSAKYMPVMPNDVAEQIINKHGFVISYNHDTRLPNWVMWRLKSDHLTGDATRSGNSYHEDGAVPKPRAAAMDYHRSGWTRGHMCPAADNKWNKRAMFDSFAFTNICPQTERLNSGVWNEIEMDCREWARKYGEVFIICGPVPDRRLKTIGPNHVVVPEAFFKVVVCLKGGKKKGIGFICYNDEKLRQSEKQCVASIEDIEDLTGINFFPNLNPREQKKIEQHARLRDW
ncbi:MAG: DNA/RNA non-specific endonuclease [Bacteroidales bacterium]|nr:DNA/RNA non-specific endonuclease [Bacteroidales bacterium]